MKKSIQLSLILVIMTCFEGLSQTISFQSNKHRVTTPSGYIDLGPMNSSLAHIYTDRPAFIFNKTIYSYYGFFSSFNTSNLALQTNGTTRLTILKSNGNVGIGNTSPIADLHVGNATEAFVSPNADLLINNNGRSDLVLRNSQSNTEISLTAGTDNNFIMGRSGGLQLITNMAGDKVVLDAESGNDELTVVNGKVGILTANPSYELDVVGTINANSILVNGSPISSGGSSLWSQNGSDLAYENGNVGIGTNAPEKALDVRGSVIIDKGDNAAIFTGRGTSELSRYLTLLNSPNHTSASGLKAGGILISDTYAYANPGKNDLIVKGNVGLGTPSPVSKLDIKTSAGSLRVDALGASSAKVSSTAALGLEATSGSFIQFLATGSEIGRFTSDGNLGIGTTNPSEKLEVAGTIRTREVKVEVAAGTGPDYVFEPTYHLKSLEEVEQYIQSAKHLPEVPSAREMEANGVQLGEMNMLLLKKIEELTLYAISQEKRISELEPYPSLLIEREAKQGELEKNIEELTLHTIEQQKKLNSYQQNQAEMMEIIISLQKELEGLKK